MTNKQLKKYWDIFDMTAIAYGYKCNNHDDLYMGIGSMCYKADKFAPLIHLRIEKGYKVGKEVIIPTSMNILVEDRNGNNILDGNVCGVYRLEDCDDFENKFTDMCKYVFDKYVVYSKDNRLDFVFNGYKEERIKWNNM